MLLLLMDCTMLTCYSFILMEYLCKDTTFSAIIHHFSLKYY